MSEDSVSKRDELEKSIGYFDVVFDFEKEDE
jgi:hypothetical protein